MSDRYFIDEPISLGRAVLAGPEAHHLIHVMRAAAGMRVVLFDGSGAEFPAVVRQVGRNDVELSVVSREEVNRELPVEVTLGVALPKGDRQKWLVEKAVELGVTRIVPLRTQRGVAQPVEQALVRLRRAVVEASKQCGRNRLLQIDRPQDWSDFVADAGDVPGRLLAHPQPEKAAATPSWPEDRATAPFPGRWAGGRVHRRRGGPGDGRRLAHDRSRPAHPSRGDGRPAVGGPGGRPFDALRGAGDRLKRSS